MRTLVNTILNASDRINNGRTVQDVLNHAITEMGELALEIQIDQGKSYKTAGEDGIVGEALDVIACMVDIIQLKMGPWAHEEKMVEWIQPKLDKWEQKELEIQQKKLERMTPYDVQQSDSCGCSSCSCEK